MGGNAVTSSLGSCDWVNQNNIDSTPLTGRACYGAYNTYCRGLRRLTVNGLFLSAKIAMNIEFSSTMTQCNMKIKIRKIRYLW